MCPIAPNVVRTMDFQFDQTADGRTLKLLNVIDEYTRESCQWPWGSDQWRPSNLTKHGQEI
jgi:hypothetical protein